MLDFFRKYQKAIFFVTAIGVILSVIFFGAAQVISPAFVAQGVQKKDYLSQVKSFLNTEQWMLSRKIFAANFLNDGVISKEILESSIGEQLVKKYAEHFQPEFNERHEKEKSYQPYAHPFIPSLTAESLWALFAPELPQKIQHHLASTDDFNTRCALFQSQKTFPPAFFSQILRYQEQQQNKYDPKLAKEDVYLFGYHTLSDWFGDQFVEACAKLIIQSAAIARSQGFKVTREEALADLVGQAQEVYKALKNKLPLPVEDGYGLFQLYLSQIGMNEESAIKIWQDVSLFRRLIQTAASSSLNDVLAFSDFYSFAYENALVEVYEMPKEHLLRSMDDLKCFETYLSLCGERRQSVLDIPLHFAPLAKVQELAPQLVGRRYLVEYRTINQNLLDTKVSLKEIVEWQCDPQNWPLLQNKFAFLAQKDHSFETIEALGEKERKQVERFACKQIVAAHNEWLEEMLADAKSIKKELFLTESGESSLAGIKNCKDLMAKLDAEDTILAYTQDGENHYAFQVKSRGDLEILTFKEAKERKLLDKLFAKAQADLLVEACVDATPAPFKEQPFAYRFARYIEKYKDQTPEGSLIQQFPIVKMQKTIVRSEPTSISLDEALSLKEDYSKVQVDATSGAFIYRLIERKQDKTLPLDKIVQSQEMLSKEASNHCFEKILSQVKLF